MMKIFINPGHDIDLDPGACSNGLREVDVALSIGKHLKNIMEGIGYPCLLLQSDNLNGETAGKPNVCKTANESDADIFISIHCNAATNTSAKGTETWVYKKGIEAENLAKCINSQIVKSLNTQDRGIKSMLEQNRRLAVLIRTNMPAVLIETAFISNEEDAFKLANRQYAFAAAIARGITDYEQLLLNK